MSEGTTPIQEALDDIIPDWREQARRMAEDGMTSAEITAEFQSQMKIQVDALLDTLGALSEGK